LLPGFRDLVIDRARTLVENALGISIVTDAAEFGLPRIKLLA
jgi:hypothetical protein